MPAPSRVNPRAWLHAALANALIDHWRDIALLAVVLALLVILGAIG